MKRYSLVDCDCQKDYCDAHLEEDSEGFWVTIDDYNLLLNSYKKLADNAIRNECSFLVEEVK